MEQRNSPAMHGKYREAATQSKTGELFDQRFLKLAGKSAEGALSVAVLCVAGLMLRVLCCGSYCCSDSRFVVSILYGVG